LFLLRLFVVCVKGLESPLVTSDDSDDDDDDDDDDVVPKGPPPRSYFNIRELFNSIRGIRYSPPESTVHVPALTSTVVMTLFTIYAIDRQTVNNVAVTLDKWLKTVITCETVTYEYITSLTKKKIFALQSPDIKIDIGRL